MDHVLTGQCSPKKGRRTLIAVVNVALDMPKWVERGLEAGDYIRKGGIIIEAGSNRVVHWLRPSAVEQTSDALQVAEV